MEAPTLPKRKYNSARRQAQARETRLQIIQAARKLFTQRGYDGTTIEAIANEAGIARETVFANYGNKRTILAKLIDVSVGGDDQPMGILERPEPQAVLHETDPLRQLSRFAQDIAGILDRTAPVMEVLRIAAKSEPAIAELLKDLLDRRLHNMTVLVSHVRANTPLREGLEEAQAAELVWTLTSPEVYRLLVSDRGWSKQRYSQWLADALIRLLLP